MMNESFGLMICAGRIFAHFDLQDGFMLESSVRKDRDKRAQEEERWLIT